MIAPVIPTTAYIVAVMFVATLIRSTFGFGEALIAVPLVALRAPVTVAAPLAVLLSIVVAAVIVVRDWRHVDVRSASGLFVPSLVGIPVGLALLVNVNDHVVKVALGAVIIAFAAWALTAGRDRQLRGGHQVWLISCGLLAGVLGGAYGMNGPPLVVYGALRRWSPQRFRATLQGYFLPASIAGAIGYASIGLLNDTVTRDFLWSLPAVGVAIVAGRSINARIDSDRFLRLVYAGLLLIGAVLIGQAIGAPPSI
ncbi:MAG TPA: sulfite exporter TauE/SafE family protein [Vicinamibacterales bacterium]|nr:sulfite exporter TauE/SafE family protein [Vicinamibacterales bacterium]